jgi:hypothetical protein
MSHLLKSQRIQCNCSLSHSKLVTHPYLISDLFSHPHLVVLARSSSFITLNRPSFTSDLNISNITSLLSYGIIYLSPTSVTLSTSGSVTGILEFSTSVFLKKHRISPFSHYLDYSLTDISGNDPAWPFFTSFSFHITSSSLRTRTF